MGEWVIAVRSGGARAPLACGVAGSGFDAGPCFVLCGWTGTGGTPHRPPPPHTLCHDGPITKHSSCHCHIPTLNNALRGLLRVRAFSGAPRVPAVRRGPAPRRDIHPGPTTTGGLGTQCAARRSHKRPQEAAKVRIKSAERLGVAPGHNLGRPWGWGGPGDERPSARAQVGARGQGAGGRVARVHGCTRGNMHTHQMARSPSTAGLWTPTRGACTSTDRAADAQQRVQRTTSHFRHRNA
jgi:hypothetical protein